VREKGREGEKVRVDRRPGIASFINQNLSLHSTVDLLHLDPLPPLPTSPKSRKRYVFSKASRPFTSAQPGKSIVKATFKACGDRRGTFFGWDGGVDWLLLVLRKALMRWRAVGGRRRHRGCIFEAYSCRGRRMGRLLSDKSRC
jgi:hypothetical protein